MKSSNPYLNGYMQNQSILSIEAERFFNNFSKSYGSLGIMVSDLVDAPDLSSKVSRRIITNAIRKGHVV